MEDILIKHALILTMDPQRRTIEDGAIVLGHDRIVAVGNTKEIERKYEASRILDAQHMICMPGLINGHNHYEQSFFKGFTRVYTGDVFDWIRNFKTALTRVMNANDYYLANLLACVELIRFGVTCSVNHVCQHRPESLREFGIENIMRAILDSGIKTEVVIGVSDVPEIEAEDFVTSTKSGLQLLETTIRNWHNKADGRIHVWTGPFILKAASVEFWHQINDLSNQSGTGIHTHVNGNGEMVTADELGLLSQSFTAAHCQNLNSQEIRLLYEKHANVVHSPTYILPYATSWPTDNFGDGIAPITDLLETGVTVGIGTDGCLGDTQDMFREMRNIAYQQHYKTGDKKTMPPSKLLEMVTIDNAKTLRWQEEIGSIEVGKKGDIILANMQNPYMVPWINTPASVVYLMSGYDVRTVIVDGKILMENGNIINIDIDELLQEAQAAASKLIERAGLKSLKEKGFKPWNSCERFN